MTRTRLPRYGFVTSVKTKCFKEYGIRDGHPKVNRFKFKKL